MIIVRDSIVDRLAELAEIELAYNLLDPVALANPSNALLRKFRGEIVIAYGHLEGGLKDCFIAFSDKFEEAARGKSIRQLSGFSQCFYATSLIIEHTPPKFDTRHDNIKNFYDQLFGDGYSKDEKIFKKFQSHIIPDAPLLGVGQLMHPSLAANAEYINIKKALAFYGIDVTALLVNSALINTLVATRHKIAHAAGMTVFGEVTSLQVSAIGKSVAEVRKLLASVAASLDALPVA